MKLFRLGLLAFLAGLPLAASAGVSGSKPMLCAITEALECPYELDCSAGSVESMNLPPFVQIDTKAKLMTEHEGGRKTPLSSVAERDGQIVIQGYENRAFSITISKQTGRLTAAAAGPSEGIVLFGICTDL